MGKKSNYKNCFNLIQFIGLIFVIVFMVFSNIQYTYCQTDGMIGYVIIGNEGIAHIEESGSTAPSYNIKNVFESDFVKKSCTLVKKVAITLFVIDGIMYFVIIKDEKVKKLFGRTMKYLIIIYIFVSCRAIIGATLQQIVDWVVATFD